MLLNFLLWPFSILYSAITDFRNLLYQTGVLKTHRVSTPVISVGNITTGGTGKTPVVEYILNVCKDLNIRVAVVSRGYGGMVKTPSRVGSQNYAEAAKRFGDEPAMLAWKHPEAAVFTGRDRVAVCLLAIDEFQPELIVADDAFQHRRLGRDLDLVILDASKNIEVYRVLPWGRARERFKHLSRAHRLIFSKVNLGSKDSVSALRRKIAKLKGVTEASYSAHFQSQNLRDLSGKKVSWDEIRGKNCLLTCGIGNPEAFAEMVGQKPGLKISGSLFFRDHFSYTEEDIEHIISKKTETGADCILCTEKDGVKLLPWKEKIPGLLMVELSIQWDEENSGQGKELSALVAEIAKKDDLLGSP